MQDGITGFILNPKSPKEITDKIKTLVNNPDLREEKVTPKMINDYEVAEYRQKKGSYPDNPPFPPSQNFPKYPFKGHFCSENDVYDSIRKLLRYLRLDEKNYGSSNWNPLSTIIKKGDTVLVKPNMIAHSHRYSDEWEHVITHGSVLRAVIDYVFLALGVKVESSLPMHHKRIQKST